MSPDQLHLYAIVILTLIGVGIFIGFLIAAGFLFFAVVEGLVRLYDWVEGRKSI
jgi:hypothetical protein